MTPIPKSLRASITRPTTSVAGDEAPTVIRGEGMMLRGLADGTPYFDAWGGNRDLGENFNVNVAAFKISGTISYTLGNPVISGAGTDFITELHYGQIIQSAAGEPIVVGERVSPTSFLAQRVPTTTASGQFAIRLPQMQEANGKRVCLLTGNIVIVPKGHIIGVGSGEVYMNGAVLPGASLTLANRAKVAIFKTATANYEIRDLGYVAPPPAPVINSIAGGTKKMPDGLYSFMISYWSGELEGTDGFSDPCTVVKLDGAAAPIEIKAGSGKEQFEFDFTTSLVGMPANAKGFIIYGSMAGKKTVAISGATTTTQSTNQTCYESGPWYKVTEVLVTDLTAGDKHNLEYLDAELLEEAEGSNDRPPPSEFIFIMEGRPVYVSCYGKATVAEKEGMNPGPSCVMGKFNNPDAAPADWSARISGDIIGWFKGPGRWFLTSSSSLEFVAPSGLPGQLRTAIQELESPLLSRPYWEAGASNRYSMCMLGDDVYGFCGGKVFRSIGNGDENVDKYEFGSVIEDLTRSWSSGHVYTIRDPKNTFFLLIHTAAYKNASGYWVSEILPYSPGQRANAWLPKLILSSTTQDMIVSGIAVVNERLEFLCGGRVSGGTYQVRTYRFDEEEANRPDVPYYIAWQPSDDGVENMMKQLHYIRAMGRFHSGQVTIHGAVPGGTINLTDVETGANPIGGVISLANTTEITQYLMKRLKIGRLGTYIVRLAGVSEGGSGKAKDRLDELIIGVSTHGRQR